MRILRHYSWIVMDRFFFFVFGTAPVRGDSGSHDFSVTSRLWIQPKLPHAAVVLLHQFDHPLLQLLHQGLHRQRQKDRIIMLLSPTHVAWVASVSIGYVRRVFRTCGCHFRFLASRRLGKQALTPTFALNVPRVPFTNTNTHKSKRKRLLRRLLPMYICLFALFVSSEDDPLLLVWIYSGTLLIRPPSGHKKKKKKTKLGRINGVGSNFITEFKKLVMALFQTQRHEMLRKIATNKGYRYYF